jgi:hypothetical protein
MSLRWKDRLLAGSLNLKKNRENNIETSQKGRQKLRTKNM